jgi:hypothetical protein
VRARTVVAAALLAAGGLLPAAFAHESQADLCAVAIGRGATAPGGATGTMTMRNVGRACRIVNFTVPEQRVATSRLAVVRAPAQGRVVVLEPNVVAYSPNIGYTGPDEFQYEGSGPGRDGRTIPFSVRIKVQVVDRNAPLR